MAQLLRCDDLIAEFSMRIGQPEDGTFGMTHYDSLNGDVDELRSILNQAQRHVAWKCYSANQTILEATDYIQVLSGVTRYTLAEDFLGPVSVYYRAFGQEYEVEKKNFNDIRSTVRSERYSYYYEFYEIRENVPAVAARGVVSEDSLTSITDDNLRTVRVGDTVHNLTDASYGEVEAVYPGTNRIEVNELINGDANRFQKGDIYQVDMKEATRDAIDFWPIVIKDDSSQSHSGNARNWDVNEDSVLQGVSATITTIPVTFETDERLIMNLIEDDEVVGVGAREGLSQGANQFFFPNPIQLREDVFYTVEVVRSNGTAIDIDSIQVFVSIEPDVIAFKHAKLPRVMGCRTDYCEMPSWSLEAVYSYAHLIAQKKVTRNPMPDRGLVAVFNQDIQDIKDFLFKRDERGPHQLPILGGRSHGWPYPSNYGYGVVDPFDL